MYHGGVKISKKLLSDVMREIGRNGWSKAGTASADALTKEQRSERGRKAVLARWAKQRKKNADALP